MGEIPLPENLDGVVCYALCFFWVIEKIFHGGGEIGEIAFDFYKILV